MTGLSGDQGSTWQSQSATMIFPLSCKTLLLCSFPYNFCSDEWHLFIHSFAKNQWLDRRSILFSTQTLNQNYLVSQNCATPTITTSLPYRGVCLKPSHALNLTANTITAKLTNRFTMIYCFRLITLD